MEDLLVDKDQWIMVDLSTKPMTVFDEEWKKLDQKAKSTIIRGSYDEGFVGQFRDFVPIYVSGE